MLLHQADYNTKGKLASVFLIANLFLFSGKLMVRSQIAQVSYGSRFHRQQYPYGGAGFKPDGDSRCSYVSFVIS